MVVLQPSGQMALRVSASMITLSTLAVALRVFARTVMISALAIEDILIFLALGLFYTDQGLFLAGVLGPKSGGTVDQMQMLPSQVEYFLKNLYVEEIVFVTTITLIKLSILSFYTHIFTVKRFRQCAWALGGVCIVWYLIMLFIVIFQCSPVDAAWRFELQLTPGASKCLQIGRVIFGLEISNVIIDVSILVLPIFMVQRLQMKTSRKISISSIFLLGGFVCVSCIVRAYWIFDPSTGNARSLPAAMNWTTVELATAIVCACLPTYGPLLRSTLISTKFKSWYTSLLSNFRTSHRSKDSHKLSQASNSTTSTATNHEKQSSFNQIYDGTADAEHLTQVVGKPPISRRDFSSGALPMNEIQVERTLEVV